MKKIFKALAVTAATVALGGTIAMTAGCAEGYTGTFVGEYHYLGYYGQEYGMVVEVTVEKNIITGIKDLTNDAENEQAKALQTYKDVVDGKEAEEATYHEWHAVSAGWNSYFLQNANAYYCWILYNADGTGDAAMGDKYYAELNEDGQRTGNFIKWDGESVVPEASTKTAYGWSTDDETNWTSHTSWLLDQYIGWSVSDIMNLTVYTNYGYAHVTGASNYNTAIDKNAKGEPYQVAFNSDLQESGLLITGSTQGSGRLLLAVQDALSK